MWRERATAVAWKHGIDVLLGTEFWGTNIAPLERPEVRAEAEGLKAVLAAGDVRAESRSELWEAYLQIFMG
jgi:hypothetical protein